MARLTEDDIALLNEPYLAHLAVIDSDGAPHVTPVWVDTDGEHILINTAKGRKKYNSIARDPHVAVSVVDKNDDWHTLWVKGTAELVEDGADAHIDKMAKKYIGKDTYPFRQPGEERVIIRITPEHKLRQA
jgi:PPOX class probable F420-dependent enzyme